MKISVSPSSTWACRRRVDRDEDEEEDGEEEEESSEDEVSDKEDRANDEDTSSNRVEDGESGLFDLFADSLFHFYSKS